MAAEGEINRGISEILIVGPDDRVTAKDNWFGKLATIFEEYGLISTAVDRDTVSSKLLERLPNGYRAYVVDADTKDLGEETFRQIRATFPGSYIAMVSECPDFEMTRHLFRMGVSNVVTKHSVRHLVEWQMQDIISPSA